MDSDERLPIFLVDDDRTSLRVAASWLHEERWECQCFHDSPTALEAFARRPPAVAVLDWSMPRIDGLEMLRRIRSENQARTCYVILVTASLEHEVLLKAFEEGADDFLRKPLARPEFLSRLKAARRVSLLEQEVRRRSEQDLERQSNASALQRLSAVGAAVAHELRTPVGALRLAVERLHLKRERLPEEFRPLSERLDGLATHLSETLENVLESFGLAGAKTSWKVVDWNEQVREGASLLQHKVPSGVALHLEMPPAPILGSGEAAGLRRLVANLGGNALRHTREGSVTIRLSLVEPELARLEVFDTGEGIPRELLPWLGEPLLLNSENAAIGPLVRGSGLGLALCRRIAERHGGSLTLESSPGQGTRVCADLRLDLPRPRSERLPAYFRAG